jgi:hypothetical protein
VWTEGYGLSTYGDRLAGIYDDWTHRRLGASYLAAT